MIRRPPRSTLFPTRRSSDLLHRGLQRGHVRVDLIVLLVSDQLFLEERAVASLDRKSTRLNSSHQIISYAVFCLKKKKKKTKQDSTAETTRPDAHAAHNCTSQ